MSTRSDSASVSSGRHEQIGGIAPHLFVFELLENLPTLTVVIRPLAKRPRRLENIRAVRMLHAARPERGVSFSTSLRPHPRRQPAPATLRLPSFALLLSAAGCLGRPSGLARFSMHVTPIRGLVVPHGPLGRAAGDLVLNPEVKVGDSFAVVLGVCAPAAPRIRPIDHARVRFLVRATAVHDKGWWRFGL
jgi:hypothetical protein